VIFEIAVQLFKVLSSHRSSIKKHFEPSTVKIGGNYLAINWLIRHSLVENITQNWLGQEPTSVITVGNYWAISWLTRHSLVENIRQNWSGLISQFIAK
jgi:hypothetical protein